MLPTNQLTNELQLYFQIRLVSIDAQWIWSSPLAESKDPRGGVFVRQAGNVVKFSLCLTKFYAMKTYPLLNRANAIKTYWGSESITPRIPYQGPRWRWAVSFTFQPLYPRSKSPRNPLGGPQSRAGRCGEEKNSQPLPGFEPIIQPVA